MNSTAPIYDSSVGRRPILTEIENLRRHWGLIRLLVVRDLTVRYKRSTLGVWWTVLNPLLTSLALWIIFGQVFRFEIPGVPYGVYLLSGILFMTFVSQGVVTAGAAIVNGASILTKVRVPPEIFSFSASVAAGANFLLSLIPLLIVQVLTDVGIPWTMVLVPIPFVATVGLIVGIGLLVASAAVYFYDVLDLTGVLLQLVSYMTPTFYPLSIVPPHFLGVVYANPLYSYLAVFRGFAYEGVFAPAWTFVVMGATSVGLLTLGIWVFSRSWRNLVVRI